MLTVSPFAALLPTPERAAQVAAVPYDVVSTAEARRLADGNPYSFLRVSRPEIELPPDTDPHATPVYDLAAANFARLRQQAPLTFDSAPHYYVYSLLREGRRQSGLVAALAVDDYDEGRIQQHERTRADKEEDRTRHTLALRAHSGPVFLICRSAWAMDSTVQEVMGQNAPLFDVRSDDGVVHQVWRVPAEDYAPILQDAVLLKAGEADPAAVAFLAFLRGDEARAIIEKYGYEIAAGN